MEKTAADSQVTAVTVGEVFYGDGKRTSEHGLSVASAVDVWFAPFDTWKQTSSGVAALQISTSPTALHTVPTITIEDFAIQIHQSPICGQGGSARPRFCFVANSIPEDSHGQQTHLCAPFIFHM